MYNITAQFLSDENLQARDSNTGNGKATFTGSGRFLFPVAIGGKQFNLDFDTGSPDFWVLSSKTAIAGHAYYDPSFAVPLNIPFSIGYTDGSLAMGTTYLDTVNIGGIVIQDQAVEVASFVNGTLISIPVDGIFGMSLRIHQTSGQYSVLTNLLLHGLQLQVFTVSVTRPSEKNVNGFCTFGYIPSQIRISDIYYTNIVDNNPGFWMFPSTTAKIGGKLYSRPIGNLANADTGTTLIYVDRGLVLAIYGPLRGAQAANGLWYYPASSAAFVQTITLPVGNFDVTIHPSDFGIVATSDGWILGAIQDRKNQPFDTFGDIWLSNVYAIFDLTTTQPRLGVVSRPIST